MLFTVAIPTYNNEKSILQTIESCLNQVYKNEYEILIVNNASTDKTLEVITNVALYNLKIKIINNKKTVSLFENHNICLKNSNGDYILFCHADDELSENALEILEEKIKYRKYPPKYILWGQSLFRDYFFSIDKEKIGYNTIFAGERAKKLFSSPSGLTPSGTCYSRKSIIELGGFNKMKTRITPSDWTIMLKAAINSFEFEMLDRIIFYRKFASTNNENIKFREAIFAIVDAFNILKSDLNETEVKEIKKNLYENSNLNNYFLLKYCFSEKVNIFKYIGFLIKKDGFLKIGMFIVNLMRFYSENK